MLQQKIIDIIEEFAPLGTQAEYDKCGLKTGQTDVDTTGVLVCLDLNIDIVKEAVKKNCNLIIEHHPSIWKSWKEIDPRYPKVRALLEAYSKNITVYSAHTNIDFTFGGLNDFFASQIGLEKVECLKEGRIGVLKKEMTVRSYADFIKETLSEKYVKIIGDDQILVKNVACINGAGGGDEELVLDLMKKTDVLVTSEVKYNVARLSKDIGYAIIEVSHFGSEKGFSTLIKNLLGKKAPSVTVFEAETLTDPYL